MIEQLEQAREAELADDLLKAADLYLSVAINSPADVSVYCRLFCVYWAVSDHGWILANGLEERENELCMKATEWRERMLRHIAPKLIS